jgi:hypothetical protein
MIKGEEGRLMFDRSAKLDIFESDNAVYLDNGTILDREMRGCMRHGQGKLWRDFMLDCPKQGCKIGRYIKQLQDSSNRNEVLSFQALMEVIMRLSIFVLCAIFLVVHGTPETQTHSTSSPTAQTRNGTYVGTYMPQFSQDAFYGVPLPMHLDSPPRNH